MNKKCTNHRTIDCPYCFAKPSNYQEVDRRFENELVIYDVETDLSCGYARDISCGSSVVGTPEEHLSFWHSELDRVREEGAKEERKRIIDGLFKKGHNYSVWRDGDKLSVCDTKDLQFNQLAIDNK